MRRLAFAVDARGDVHASVLPRPIGLTLGVPRPKRRLQRPPFALVRRSERGLVSVQLQDSQEVDLVATAQDAAGNVVANPGVLTWSVDDASVLTVEVDSADQAKVTARTTGKLGVATVTVSDDLDGDTTTAEAVGSLSFEIVTGPVVQIGVSAGTPRNRV